MSACVLCSTYIKCIARNPILASSQAFPESEHQTILFCDTRNQPVLFTLGYVKAHPSIFRAERRHPNNHCTFWKTSVYYGVMRKL